MPSAYQALSTYLPDGSLSLVDDYLNNHRVEIRITRERSSKLGDYRPLPRGGHRITVNHNLNKYAFLLTLVHEIAHMKVQEHFKNRVSPHGKEWKMTFSHLLEPCLSLPNIPEDIRWAYQRVVDKPKASSTSDPELMKVLHRYDDVQPLRLEDLPHGAYFAIRKRVFQKGEKRRTRYLCKDLRNQKSYLVSGIAEVVSVDNLK